MAISINDFGKAEVAAELMSADDLKSLWDGLPAATKLSHPNIVTAHDAGFARGAHYLVMEYVEGKELSHFVPFLI